MAKVEYDGQSCPVCGMPTELIGGHDDPKDDGDCCPVCGPIHVMLVQETVEEKFPYTDPVEAAKQPRPRPSSIFDPATNFSGTYEPVPSAFQEKPLTGVVTIDPDLVGPPEGASYVGKGKKAK
jgi:hypothetical protein